MYVFLKPVALPKGDTHTRTPNFRSFCALPFAAFRRIDFAGVCLSGVCSFKRREWVDSQPLSVLFVVCVCSYFLPKRGNKKLTFYASLFNTHIYTQEEKWLRRLNKKSSPRTTACTVRLLLSLFFIWFWVGCCARRAIFYYIIFPRKQILSSSFNWIIVSNQFSLSFKWGNNL